MANFYDTVVEVLTQDKRFFTEDGELLRNAVYEAAMQMDLLGHQFFVFVDQDDEKTCVVYRRRDGDYGLIVPQ